MEAHTPPRSTRYVKPVTTTDILGVSKLRMATRAFLHRCPVCGQGQLFKRWSKLGEKCPNCGLVWEREAGFFVGEVGANTILSFGTCLMVLVAGIIITYPDIAVKQITIIAVALGIIAPIFWHPVAKLLWLTVDLWISPLADDEAPNAPRVRQLGSPKN